jgi:hypothetical protein
MTSKLRFTHLAGLLQRKYDDMLDYYYVCLKFYRDIESRGYIFPYIDLAQYNMEVERSLT